MENNVSFWNYLFRPFRYLAGKESVFTGLAVLVLLFLLGFWSNTHFDGALDAHLACIDDQSSPVVHLLYEVIAWFSLVVVLYPLARYLSYSSVRLVDMAGTLATARFPLILFALWGFNPEVHLCIEGINPLDVQAVMAIVEGRLGILALTSLFSIVLSVWYIVLLYNAYTVSANLKGAKAGWSFAAGLIVSEILSKILVSQMHCLF